MKEEKTKCGNTSQSHDAFPHDFWKEIKKSKNHFVILSFYHFVINHLFFTGGSGKWTSDWPMSSLVATAMPRCCGWLTAQ